MLGQMMNLPLMISSLIQHADSFHGDSEIVSRLQMGNRDQVIEYARRSGLIGGASAFQGRFRKE